MVSAGVGGRTGVQDKERRLGLWERQGLMLILQLLCREFV
jgi:hypothetical protein